MASVGAGRRAEWRFAMGRFTSRRLRCQVVTPRFSACTACVERSGSDRVRMACEMFDFARALMVANMTAEDPDITGAELPVKIFERIYSDDFDAGTCDRIIARLRA